jgi:hypothetical protein
MFVRVAGCEFIVVGKMIASRCLVHFIFAVILWFLSLNR